MLQSRRPYKEDSSVDNTWKNLSAAQIATHRAGESSQKADDMPKKVKNRSARESAHMSARHAHHDAAQAHREVGNEEMYQHHMGWAAHHQREQQNIRDKIDRSALMGRWMR